MSRDDTDRDRQRPGSRNQRPGNRAPPPRFGDQPGQQSGDQPGAPADQPGVPTDQFPGGQYQAQPGPRGGQGQPDPQGGQGQQPSLPQSQQAPGQTGAGAQFQYQQQGAGQQPPGQFQGGQAPQTGGQSQVPAGGQQQPPIGSGPQPQGVPGQAQQTQGAPPGQSIGAAPGAAGQPDRQRMGYGTRPPRRGGARSTVTDIDAKEIAQSQVVTVDPDTPIRTVVADMNNNDVGTVVVVEDGRPRGIISDRTVALALEENPDVAQSTAADLVTENLVTIPTESTVREVLATFSEAGIRRAPIVEEDGRLAGIVALDDVIALLSDELAAVSDVIEQQSARV